MDSTKRSCLLLDVGGTFIKSCTATPDGRLLAASKFTHPVRSDGTKEEIMNSLATVVRRGVIFAHQQGLTPAGIGIAIPGPFDYANGIARMTHKFQSIYGLSLGEMLHELPEIETDLPIRFVHDVNAVLVGEMAHGNARGFANAAIITLGTGLGFAFCRNMEVQYSPTGSPLLPIYNRPYRNNILEDYISKRGFLHIYAQTTGCKPEAALTVADIGRMAREGDTAALKTFATAGAILAESLRELLCRQQIECLLLGGQISRSFVFMEQALCEGLAEVPGLTRIAAVEHIGDAAFYGLCQYLSELHASKLKRE